jgi:2-isopropylmalate synthase
MLLRPARADVGLSTQAVTTGSREHRMVSRLTGTQSSQQGRGRAQRIRPRVGHPQDGVLKERTTYEIMDATTVGLDANSVVLGKPQPARAAAGPVRAGHRAVGAGAEHRVQALGVADKKKHVTAMDLERWSPTSCARG